LDVVEREPNLGAELLSRAAAFYNRLSNAGLEVPETHSQVIPLMAGENGRALQLFEDLLTQDIFAIAIRPPSVPEGTARLRLSVTLAHTPETLDASAATIIERCAALAEAGV
jgi:8-amino-7-oxononanoate synthase